MDLTQREERFPFYLIMAAIVYRIGYTALVVNLGDQNTSAFNPLSSNELPKSLIFFGLSLTVVIYLLRLGFTGGYEIVETEGYIYEGIPGKVGQIIESSSEFIVEATQHEAAFKEGLLTTLAGYQLLNLNQQSNKWLPPVPVENTVLILERGSATALINLKTLGNDLCVSWQIAVLTEISHARQLIWLAITLFFSISPAIAYLWFLDGVFKSYFLPSFLFIWGENLLIGGAILTVGGLIFRGDAHAFLRSSLGAEEFEDAALLKLFAQNSIKKAAEKIGLSQD